MTDYTDIKPAVLKRFQKRLRRQPANPLNFHNRLRPYVLSKTTRFWNVRAQFPNHRPAVGNSQRGLISLAETQNRFILAAFRVIRMSRWLKTIPLGLVGLAAVIAGVLAILAAVTKLPGEEKIPAGTPRDTALYIKMRDGAKIAADVWLPQDYQTGQRLPTLLRTTRYGRDGQFGWAFRLAVAFKHADPHDQQIDYLNGRHFVVVLADTRGSGASSGHRETEFSPELISDLGELVNWVASQPWSNGRVGTFGNSYEGATAELTAVTNPPALKAVVPISSQFDVGMLILPGGMYNENMVQSWSAIIKELDESDVCVTRRLSGLGCWWAGRTCVG